jgi:hypothetical protein
MLALYFKCMLMNLAMPCLIILSLIALLLLYIDKRVYTLSLAMHVWDGYTGSWHVWGQNRQEKAFWVLWRGELETTRNNRSGIGDGGCTPQCILAFTVFGTQVLGVYCTLAGHELAPV